MESARCVYTCSQVSLVHLSYSEAPQSTRVDALNVRDDTEIDWKTLSDEGWNLWSAHSLQRRWLTLKKSVKGYESMTHEG
jgi:hypothetical protein